MNAIPQHASADVIARLVDDGFGVIADTLTLQLILHRPDVIAVRCTTPEAGEWFNRRRVYSPAVVGEIKQYAFYRAAADLRLTMGQGWLNRATRLGVKLSCPGAVISIPWVEALAICQWPPIEALPIFQSEWLC